MVFSEIKVKLNGTPSLMFCHARCGRNVCSLTRLASGWFSHPLYDGSLMELYLNFMYTVFYGVYTIHTTSNQLNVYAVCINNCELDISPIWFA